MRCVIAIRVSPRPAENVRYSPEMQEDECRRWASEHGHEVVGVVRDILVSGGSRSRFDSILQAIEDLHPELFVVADLSRWTRDTPTRYWAMRAILEDSGIRLASVVEPFVGSDAPFSDTITTAVVEGNLQQRLVANRKTSAGVRRAWASGKRWGPCFGWAWHPRERHEHEGVSCDRIGEWTWDEPAIRALYEDCARGLSVSEMSRRHGIARGQVRTAIGAKRQRDVVGDDLWLRAQAAGGRAPRQDAHRGNVFRALLACPFCGRGLQQSSQHWGHYRCPEWYQRTHEWTTISARRHVAPAVMGMIARVRLPDEWLAPDPPRAVPRGRVDVTRARDRLSVAWAIGNLSDERYEREMSRLDAEASVAPQPDESEVRRVVGELWLAADSIDCTSSRRAPCSCRLCPRDREVGTRVNEVLRAFLSHIELTPERIAIPHPNPEYQWCIRE